MLLSGSKDPNIHVVFATSSCEDIYATCRRVAFKSEKATEWNLKISRFSGNNRASIVFAKISYKNVRSNILLIPFFDSAIIHLLSKYCGENWKQSRSSGQCSCRWPTKKLLSWSLILIKFLSRLHHQIVLMLIYRMTSKKQCIQKDVRPPLKTGDDWCEEFLHVSSLPTSHVLRKLR